MQATFYSFSKRSNSTKQPTVGSGTNLEIKLKANCSFENPIFTLVGFNNSWTYFDWNNHYYFIDDVISINNDIVEVHGSMDALGTYKSDIGNYTAYVERSSYNYDVNLYDPLVKMSEQASTFSHEWVSPDWYSSTGCYLLRIQGRQTALSDSGLTTFVMSKEEVTNLMAICFADPENSIFDEIINIPTDPQDPFSAPKNNALARAIFNPAQYIVSCKWLPVSKISIGGAGQNVFLGWYDSGIVAQTLGSKGFTWDTEIPIPTGGSYNDFRDITEPWTVYTLYLMGLGAVPLSAKDVVTGMKAIYTLDFITGDTQICITTGGSKLISTYNCNLSVSVPIAGLVENTGATLSAVASAIGFGMSGNIAGAATSAVSAGLSIAQPTPSLIGGQGSICSLLGFHYIWLNKRVMGTSEFPTTEMGRPLCKNVKINTLSGYVKCGNASISLSATESERQKINNFLNSGFYYE